MMLASPKTTRQSWKDDLTFPFRCLLSSEGARRFQLTPIEDEWDIDRDEQYGLTGFRVKRKRAWLRDCARCLMSVWIEPVLFGKQVRVRIG